MTDTTNQTAKYSKNYSGDVGETPKSMAGTWHLEAPDGRRWAGSCPINCVAQELAERVPVQVQLARMLAIADEPDLDERHAKLGVEYGTVKVDELVDKLQAERDELRAKLDELARQRPCGYLPYGYVGRSAMVYGQPVPESVPIYLVAGARPVEPVQKLRPDFIAGYDAGMADAKRIQAHQPAPAAVVGPTNKVLWLLMAQYGLNMTVGQDMDNLLNFGRDVWNAALSATQPAPAAQAEREECAKLVESLDCAHRCGVGSEIAAAIRGAK